VTGPGWRLLEASVQGPHKERNQDSYDIRQLKEDALLVLAVADGHGSAAHKLSHIGSRLAVESFFHVVGTYVEGWPQERSVAVRKEDAWPGIPRSLVRAWRQLVDGDARGRAPEPAREEEQAEQQPAEPEPAEPAQEGPVDYVPYGTTLVGAVLTDRLLAAWQVGDGEFVVADANGRMTRPIEAMAGGLGDETDSLCSPDTLNVIRPYWRAVENRDDAPSMILACTDGLSKSFTSDESFMEFVGGLYAQFDLHGADAVEEKLGGWLKQASEYSGDDTTVVVAWRTGGGS